MKDNEKTTISLPVSLVVSAIALFICVYNTIRIHDLETQLRTKNQTVIETIDRSDNNVSDKASIPWPYYNNTQSVAGITATVNDDKTVLIDGTATEGTVVFRFISNDQTVKIPLEKKDYTLFAGVDSSLFTKECRMDAGLIKSDGTVEVLSGASGDISIDNSSGKYNGIYALSIYCEKGFVAPEKYSFKPELKEE